MDEHRRHRATSRDGTDIVGSVHGTGPPLVFVHGALADGELEWGEVVPHLADRFTCHLMSTRGRGASRDAADHSSPRLVEDVAAYADSVGLRAGLVGTSGGGRLVLGAAARGARVRAVAAYEPVVFEARDEAFAGEWRQTVAQMRVLADQGRAEDAVRLFLGTAGTREEEALFYNEEGFIAAMARYLPVDLQEFEAVSTDEAVSPTAPSALARIAVPVLVMRGARTELPWFAASVRHVASHVPHCRVQEVAGAAHLAAATAPEALAGILAEFFREFFGAPEEHWP